MEQAGTGAMTLVVADDLADLAATAENIAAALAKRPRGRGWFLTLNGEDEVVDATPGTAGKVHLAVEVGNTCVEAEVPDDDTLVAAVFTSVLERDSRWRSLAAWHEPAPAEDVKAPVTWVQARIGIGLVVMAVAVAIVLHDRVRAWIGF